MAKSFLPKTHPAVDHATNTLRCLKRDKAVPATPEELVRQRVLHWLIHGKRWSKENLRVEKSRNWVGDPTRTRVRSDLELLVDDKKVLVVVECKRADVPLGEHVDQQAKEYAIKAGAKWIWTTNGDSHGFLKKSGSTWRPVESLKPLEVSSASPVAKLEIPKDAYDAAAITRYWKSFNDDRFQDPRRKYDLAFVLAVHRLLFDLPKKLPYSHGGVHILEDRGFAWHRFGNASSGGYYTRYADFIAATQGRVEAVSVAVNPSLSGLRLCVGARKPNRAHHALQLDTDKCERDERTKSWRIYHDGRMASIERATVRRAVREAQAGRWIKKDDSGKKRIYLGRLHDTPTWPNSRRFLANLIHYGIIRSNLREAHKKRRQRESNSNA